MGLNRSDWKVGMLEGWKDGAQANDMFLVELGLDCSGLVEMAKGWNGGRVDGARPQDHGPQD